MKTLFRHAQILPSVDRRLVNPRGFVFGKQNGEIIAKGEAEDSHIMVVGGSGSGKSSCVASPTLLSWKAKVALTLAPANYTVQAAWIMINRIRKIIIGFLIVIVIIAVAGAILTIILT